MFGKVISVLIIFGLLTVFLGKWIIIPVAIILLIVLVRLFADIYWKLKDGGYI